MLTLEQFTTCCGSSKWAQTLYNQSITDVQTLFAQAETIWYEQCTETDWREAFTHHPKIGDIKSLAAKFASTQHLAGNEQKSVETASQATLEALAQANTDYENKFGFIFIVCATGKSATEMLRLLQDRLQNSMQEELNIAMGEQHKITILRLKKLFATDTNWDFLKVSQLTTHVLDTSIGKTGSNITIRLKKQLDNGAFQTIAQGVTNADGRIGDLLPPNRILTSGTYLMSFDTGAYFKSLNIKTFYPMVDIQFSIFDDAHYHVPLLVNPFGYSTYRGS